MTIALAVWRKPALLLGFEIWLEKRKFQLVAVRFGWSQLICVIMPSIWTARTIGMKIYIERGWYGMMKIIFIEGVSGVGKSTTTQKLHDKLCDMGFCVDRYREFDFPNPIDFYCTAYLKIDEYEGILAEYNELVDVIKNNTVVADGVRLVRYYNNKTPLFPEPLLDVLRKSEFCWLPTNLIPLHEYTRVYKSVWERFVQDTKNQFDYIIFDGSLIHHPINDMTRMYNATHKQIAHHMNTLIKAVGSFDPQIVYLSSDDITERLRKAHISRKQSEPTEEQILFWTKRKQMDMAVMKQLSIPCNIYDITQENWDEHINLMLDNCIK